MASWHQHRGHTPGTFYPSSSPSATLNVLGSSSNTSHSELPADIPCALRRLLAEPALTAQGLQLVTPLVDAYLGNVAKDTNARALCGKLFTGGELVYNCLDCQSDPTCVLCSDCMRNSNHEGHEVRFHRAAPGGCCDCGDVEAWNPSGFCSKHGPAAAAQLLRGEHGSVTDPDNRLPRELRDRATEVFTDVGRHVEYVVGQVLESFAVQGARARRALWTEESLAGVEPMQAEPPRAELDAATAAQVEKHKEDGNAALQAGQLETARAAYTAAIALDPENGVLHSNRCVVHLKTSPPDLDAALKDAQLCLACVPPGSRATCVWPRCTALEASLLRPPKCTEQPTCRIAPSPNSSSSPTIAA